jgi:hypothetical protein
MVALDRYGPHGPHGRILCGSFGGEDDGFLSQEQAFVRTGLWSLFEERRAQRKQRRRHGLYTGDDFVVFPHPSTQIREHDVLLKQAIAKSQMRVRVTLMEHSEASKLATAFCLDDFSFSWQQWYESAREILEEIPGTLTGRYGNLMGMSIERRETIVAPLEKPSPQQEAGVVADLQLGKTVAPATEFARQDGRICNRPHSNPARLHPNPYALLSQDDDDESEISEDVESIATTSQNNVHLVSPSSMSRKTTGDKTLQNVPAATSPDIRLEKFTHEDGKTCIGQHSISARIFPNPCSVLDNEDESEGSEDFETKSYESIVASATSASIVPSLRTSPSLPHTPPGSPNEDDEVDYWFWPDGDVNDLPGVVAATSSKPVSERTSRTFVALGPLIAGIVSTFSFPILVEGITEPDSGSDSPISVGGDFNQLFCWNQEQNEDSGTAASGSQDLFCTHHAVTLKRDPEFNHEDEIIITGHNKVPAFTHSNPHALLASDDDCSNSNVFESELPTTPSGSIRSVDDARWVLYCLEHSIQPDGQTFSEQNFVDDGDERGTAQCVPCTIFVDLKPTTSALLTNLLMADFAVICGRRCSSQCCARIFGDSTRIALHAKWEHHHCKSR